MIEKKIEQIIRQSEIWLEVLRKRTEKHISDLEVEFAVTPEPVKWEDRLNLEYKKINIGDVWGNNLFDCAWAHIKGEINPGRNLALKFNPDGEALVFDSNGKPIRGLTNFCCVYNHSFGRPGKLYIPLEELEIENNKLDLWVDVANNDPFGKFLSGKLLSCEIVSRDPRDIKLYYHFGYILDLIENSKDNYSLYSSLTQLIKSIAGEISLDMDYETVESITDKLEKGLKKGANPYLNVHAIGHSHLDLAWLWPIRETKRKAARTLSTVLSNQNKYKEYIHGISQPQQLEWVKKEYPGLYSDLKEAVKNGRIELQGGAWVEFDTNIIGGESIIRQIAYGKQYYKDEFGFDVKNLWLPDAFGYNAQLPQIMKGCGLDYFLTIKLVMNEINQFPYSTFNWEGLDGSKVLAHIPPEKDYNSTAAPGSILKAVKNFNEYGLSTDAMVLYGIGDGGGGPGEEHLEFMSRHKDINGLPNVINNRADNFFEKINKNKDKYPNYKGELYLERHQGTYTSQAKNKKYNRYIENELSLVESLALLNDKNINIEDIWKEVLLYQFHDIIPGSSIKRVYDETDVAYPILFNKLNNVKKEIILEKDKLTAFNNTSFERLEYVKKDDEWFVSKTFPYSSSQLEKVDNNSNITIKNLVIENEHIIAKLDETGAVNSITLKANNKEMLKTPVNFVLYNDCGDAWDLDKNYLYSKKKLIQAESYEIIDDTHQKGYKFTYSFGNSKMSVLISIKETSPYLRFDVNCDWKETSKMLRVEYTPNVSSTSTNFDIQYGYINRSNLLNNSQELAQIEVCAHKFVDMSEGAFGVALINDCKYGFNSKNNLISMNLLRSQMYPCVDQDKGSHSFALAIYPHMNNLDNSEVYKHAYFFNRPLYISNNTELKLTNYLDNNKIIIDWVKKSKNNEILLRTFNPTSSMQKTKVNANYVVKDMLEEHIIEVNKECLEYKPFEVKTIIIK